jgi:hypothetical protein
MFARVKKSPAWAGLKYREEWGISLTPHLS